MNSWKHQTLATAKSVSEEEIDARKVTKLDSAADDDHKKQKYFCCTDLIMKFGCGRNDKLKSSLLKTSDTIYSLLCATYMTYSTNKEKLTTATETFKEIRKEHNKLEQNIKERREILYNYKKHQKQMKDEKIWFKCRIAEYEEKHMVLKARKSKLQHKMDRLHVECKGDKFTLDQLADELDVYMSEKNPQANLLRVQNEQQDENELKALLTDITDSDVNVSGPPKISNEKEIINVKKKLNAGVTEIVTESLDKEQSQKPDKETEPVTHLPPKPRRSKKRGESRGKNQNQMPESSIQNLICEDLMTLQGCSDEEALFPSFETYLKRGKSKPSCSKVTITSESTISLFIPNCPCKKKSEIAISNEE